MGKKVTRAIVVTRSQAKRLERNVEKAKKKGRAMTTVTLSLKLQTVLNHLDEIDDVFSEMEVEKALQFQEKVQQLRKMVEGEIKHLDRKSLQDWSSTGSEQ